VAPLSLLAAAVVLLGTAAVGIVVHELSHAIALRAAGVSFRLEFMPRRTDTTGRLPTLQGPLARVRPTRLPDDLSPWHVRVAALMPLSLAVPLAFVFSGVIPDPFAAGNPILEAATIAWLGCALPSPRDFSLLWYPKRAIAAHRDRAVTGA
jgi:hypothetical protein